MIGKIILLASFLFVFYKRSDICASIARLVYARGNVERGLKWYDFAAKIGKMKFENKLLHAYLTLKEGYIDQASKMFNLLSMEPLKSEQKIRLKSSQALVYWKRKEVDEAIEMLEEVMAKAPSTASYGSLGYMYVYNGNLTRALEFNKEAFEYNNTDPIIIDNLAYTYLQMCDYENAKIYYEKLLELNPRFPEGYFAYGKYLVKSGEVEKGIELVKKALDCNFSFLSMITRREINDYLETAQNELNN